MWKRSLQGRMKGLADFPITTDRVLVGAGTAGFGFKGRLGLIDALEGEVAAMRQRLCPLLKTHLEQVTGCYVAPE